MSVPKGYTHTQKSKISGRVKSGVPTGFTHNWKYKGHWKETKLRKGKWKINFRATKSRKTAKSMGSFGIGTKGAWKVKGTQYITKTGKGKYQTNLIGYKYPLKFYIKRNKYRK